MKVKLIRDDLGAPAHLRDHPDVVIRGKRAPYWRNGAVIEVDARGAELLVGNGDAEPADGEAEAVCKGWRDSRPGVLLSREMLAKGIEPEDRERYRRGEILGYEENGDYIPGPNWIEPADEEGDE